MLWTSWYSYLSQLFIILTASLGSIVFTFHYQCIASVVFFRDHLCHGCMLNAISLIYSKSRKQSTLPRSERAQCQPISCQRFSVARIWNLCYPNLIVVDNRRLTVSSDTVDDIIFIQVYVLNTVHTIFVQHRNYDNYLLRSSSVSG